MANTYVVTVSNLPGVTLTIGDAELEQLQDLGLITSILSATVEVPKVVVTDGNVPTVPVGTVWYNRSA